MPESFSTSRPTPDIIKTVFGTLTFKVVGDDDKVIDIEQFPWYTSAKLVGKGLQHQDEQ